MITVLQDVSNVSGVNVAPVRDRALLTGEVRPLPATPSAIVMLGRALQPPLTYNALGRLESQVVPLPFIPGAPLSNPAITLEPPVAANIVTLLGTTFNPVIPGATDLSSLVTPVPGLPATRADGIPDAAPTFAGAPNTASFALPPPTASAPPVAAEADRAIPLAAGTGTFATTASTVAAGATTEEPATAAPLTPADSADSRMVTPDPGAITERATSATERAEAVLTALNASSANTVTAAPNVVGAPTAASTDTLAPAVPVAPDALATPAVTTTAAATPSAPNVVGSAIPGVPNADAVPAQVRAPALGDTLLTTEDLLRNPFYPAMAASLYLSAMSFRLQQSSAAELDNPADSVQMVGGVRAVAAVQSDRQGPADDFRNMTRTFA